MRSNRLMRKYVEEKDRLTQTKTRTLAEKVAKYRTIIPRLLKIAGSFAKKIEVVGLMHTRMQQGYTAVHTAFYDILRRTQELKRSLQRRTRSASPTWRPVAQRSKWSPPTHVRSLARTSARTAGP